MAWGYGVWGTFLWGSASVDQTKGRTWLVNDDGNMELTSEGLLVRDSTVATRCRFRIKCRRGRYIYDSNLGSRLWTIKTLREGQEKAASYVNEALQDLLDDGLITRVEVGDIVTNSATGFLFVPVTIYERGGNKIDLGLLRIGT